MRNLILLLSVCVFLHFYVIKAGVHNLIRNEDEKTVRKDERFKPPNETDKMHWPNIALETMYKKMKYFNKYLTEKNFAKNIIFFLGDGMSIPTITAARIYQGQLKNSSGEEEKLFFEEFPVNGLSKTYCVDSQVADSACSGTAYMTGIKSNILTIGVTSDVKYQDCKSANNSSLHATSLIQWAQKAGKGTGVITNTRITHATPAAAYAHTSDRNFESDADIVQRQQDPLVCKDIASQLILQNPGNNIKVLMGGGRAKFIPKNKKDPISGNGERLDGVDLIEKWIEQKNSKGFPAKVVYTADQLEQVDPSKTEYLFGLFNADHMKYHLESDEKEPTLEQMTAHAIKMLKKEKNGFVLFVEGGKIDIAHHSNKAHIALDETVELAKAVKVAASMTDEEDTLIVVTADHAHTMSMSGYPYRGTNIFKFAGEAVDKLLYSTLSYANGPGYQTPDQKGRYNISADNVVDIQYKFPATVPLKYETHGGDDVAVYARGPWSHLFTGTYEQNFIPIAEAFAANIPTQYDEPEHKSSSGNISISSTKIILFSIIIIFLAFFCQF